jgi:arylsulfatase A-like enzyme
MATQWLTAEVPERGSVTLQVRLAPNPELQRAAERYTPPTPVHLAQKKAYLESIAARNAGRPNIVVIFFDDLGYGDLSSFGNSLIKTPRIDALGARGMKLTAFYSGSPVCTPSRAALLTGRYPTRSHTANHVFFPSSHWMVPLRRTQNYANAIPADEIMIPEVLRAAGYETGMFGKWHLGDRSGHLPGDFGFGTYFGVLHSNDMQPLAMWRNREIETPSAEVEQATLTERFTDEAISFIRANRDRPFFAYVPYTAPHLPHVPHPDHTGVSEGGKYGDVIEDLDRNVGRIVDTLDELGLSEDTLIVVTSDNGGDWGGSPGPLRGQKGQTWDGGQRVPAFVIWPERIAAGSENRSMAMNIDLLPTILGILGIDPPADRIVDGRSMAPILWGNGQTPHDYLYYVTAMSGEFQAIRSERFKYRRVVAQKSHMSPLGSSEFYMATPALYRMDEYNEAHDVSLKHPEVAAQLAAQLDAWIEANERNPRGWLNR